MARRHGRSERTSRLPGEHSRVAAWARARVPVCLSAGTCTGAADDESTKTSACTKHPLGDTLNTLR